MPPEQVKFGVQTATPRRANVRGHGTEGDASMQRNSTGRPPTVFPGDRFGRLVVMTEAGRANGGRTYLCRCDCGAEAIVRACNLRNGHTRSCGCLSGTSVTHGHDRRGARSATYQTWTAMVRRCRNPNASGYENYGGRGIEVCQRWLTFDVFLADMGERPEGRTLDRIDPDGNYQPSNCRWATSLEQRHNRRRAA